MHTIRQNTRRELLRCEAILRIPVSDKILAVAHLCEHLACRVLTKRVPRLHCIEGVTLSGRVVIRCSAFLTRAELGIAIDDALSLRGVRGADIIAERLVIALEAAQFPAGHWMREVPGCKTGDVIEAWRTVEKTTQIRFKRLPTVALGAPRVITRSTLTTVVTDRSVTQALADNLTQRVSDATNADFVIYVGCYDPSTLLMQALLLGLSAYNSALTREIRDRRLWLFAYRCGLLNIRGHCVLCFWSDRPSSRFPGGPDVVKVAYSVLQALSDEDLRFTAIEGAIVSRDVSEMHRKCGSSWLCPSLSDIQIVSRGDLRSACDTLLSVFSSAHPAGTRLT